MLMTMKLNIIPGMKGEFNIERMNMDFFNFFLDKTKNILNHKKEYFL